MKRYGPFFRMSLFAQLKKQALIVAAVALWIPAVAFGVGVLWNYSNTPGHQAKAPEDWPAGVPVERLMGRPTLVMFAHTQCPCSQASVGELATIMAHARGRLDAHVFFYLAAGEDDSWAKNDLWRSAAGIPGVRVLEDPQGGVARSFGAFTSGQTLLYDSSGRLLFKALRNFDAIGAWT